MSRSAAASVERRVPPSATRAGAEAALYGTWRLVTFTQEIVATGETVDVFGKAPVGFINYSDDGRMIVLMVKDTRPRAKDLSAITDQMRAELFKTMVAYAGTYEFDGKAVTHHLDISWNQVFTGGDQIRNITFDGGKLVMSTNPQPRSQDGQIAISVLTFERIKP